MALAMATLAHGGQRPRPRLVLAVGEGVGSGDGAIPGASERVLSERTARWVSQALAEAHQVGRPGTSLAGWAASAESGRPGAPPHAWYIGYAPLDAPRYAVAVIVEYGRDGWGVAAPIGVELLEQTLRVSENP
jgi:cell division protein FtsI/penicillin-binding protein 2